MTINVCFLLLIVSLVFDVRVTPLVCEIYLHAFSPLDSTFWSFKRPDTGGKKKTSGQSEVKNMNII